MKRDASSPKGNSGGAKAEASLKLPDGNAKAELELPWKAKDRVLGFLIGK